ncbi:MAG: sigma-54-dependent Fis family transcriptional regulator [Deltaproteobacteria bacterium]|nr:sigma-54-dependent Fis family transcriptional regulator [Deltaproteobacteria bacterium]
MALGTARTTQPLTAQEAPGPAVLQRGASGLPAEQASAAQVLIVEDDVAIAARISRALVAAHYDVRTVSTAREAMAVVGDAPPGVVLLDLSLPDSSDLALFHRIRAAAPRARVVIMTAMDDLDVVIGATRAGAFDFITKAPDVLQRVMVTVRNATDLLAREDQVAALASSLARSSRFGRMIAQSPSMDDVKAAIDKLATSRVNVLITGQSGTGKEVVARTIHEAGPRHGQPFVAVNCAGIPDTLLESELFGYERGAFTGAGARKIGKFEAAHGGTLFLDEIGEMSLTLQVKLLRVLQDGRFERLGGNAEVRSDARVLCATNRDLQAMVRHGQFREDLYYRIAVFSLHLPPLSARKEDIAPLVDHFVRSAARDEGKAIAGVSPEVMRLFEMHTWPGNVRQLQNVLARSAVVCTTSQISLRDLPETFVRELPPSPRPEGLSAAAASAPSGATALVQAARLALNDDQFEQLRHGPVQTRLDLALTLAFPGPREVPRVDDLEEAAVRLALRRTDGSMKHAATQLGMSRATLYRRVAKMPEVRPAADEDASESS